MGNIVGRPRRRGLPKSSRAFVPGSTLSDVRDGDVVVLCSSDGTPLRLDVAADADRAADRASTSGRPGAGAGTSEHVTFTPAFALVPGAGDPDSLAGALANAANHVVVDVRGRHVAFRSVAAGDAYLCFETNTHDEAGDATETNHARPFARLRFRVGKKDVRRRGLWRWAYDETADEVRFAPRTTEETREKNETASLFIVAVGPRRATRVAAARVWVEHLRLELEARARLAEEVRHLRARAAEARAAAMEHLMRARDTAEARLRSLATRRSRRAQRDELRFLDGLTGVVDALRDQVKGAATEPVNAMRIFEASFEENEETKKQTAGDGGKENENENEPSETTGRRASWRVDEAHLATAAAVWDLSVTEFRAALQKHGVEDAPVAALQEAIQKSAFEHFVAAGMRRYLLNRDDDDDDDDETRDKDEDDGTSLHSSRQSSLRSSPARSPASQKLFSSSEPGKFGTPEKSLTTRHEKKPEWERAVGAESRRRRDARARRAERRARLKARARAGEAAVDFRKWKVGSLRSQLERSGVDAGPLAALVHCLAHAARERGSELYVSAASAAAETGGDGRRESLIGAPVSSRDAFRAFLAREKLGEDLRYLRSERLGVAADASAAMCMSPERARVANAMASPAKASVSQDRRGFQTTPFSASLLSSSHATVRAAAAAAAAAAAVAEADRADPAGGRDLPAAALAVLTFVGSLSLADLRAELEVHSLLACGVDECVEALVETEWESGDDGFIAARGERAAAMTRSLTVEQFRRRLQAHGLEGSLLELNLLTDALATALGAPETR